MTEFKSLDPLLHQPLRLAIMSLLANVVSAEFTYIKSKTGATAGNLSVQIDKLHQANYLEVKKDFKARRPRTTCTISPKGKQALTEYTIAIKSYLNL